MTNDYVAGASAARQKLAAFMRENGVSVTTSNYGRPPTDEDFLRSVLSLVRDQGQTTAVEPAVVVFDWWTATYSIPVPLALLDVLSASPGQRRTIFTARGRTYPTYLHTFYLAADSSGTVRVFHEKDGLSEIEDNAFIVMPEAVEV